MRFTGIERRTDMSFAVTDFLKDGKLPGGYKDIYNKAGFGNDLARSRGPFVMYLLSEKGFSYDDLKAIENGTFAITQEEKEQLYKEFIDELAAHPLWNPVDENKKRSMHPDNQKNSRIYGRWFKNGMKKIMNDVMPEAGEINTPNDAFDYLHKFNMLNWYVKDIVQEYEEMWKNPESRGAVVYEMGDEEMGIFSRVEVIQGVVSSLKDYSDPKFPGKYRAMFYPMVKDFIDEVSGKSFKDINLEKIVKTYYQLAVMNMHSSSFNDDKEAGDPKYAHFIETGEADFDVNEIKFKSLLSNKTLTLKEGLEEMESQVSETMADVYSPGKGDFTKYVSEEKINSLLGKVPEDVEYRPNAPAEEREAVRNLYMDTVCQMTGYYNNALNFAKGETSEDIIKIDGKSIRSIVDEKYQTLNLTKEQRQAAVEYEFVTALRDSSLSLEFTPYIMSKHDAAIVPGQTVKVTQYNVELNRTYDDSVSVLMDEEAQRKNGKSLCNLLRDAENIYHKLYNDSNRLTDSTEFKRMLGSFKEIHEVYESINATGLVNNNEITDEVFNSLAETTGYTKEMLGNLIKETAKNCDDYITAKNASGKYRSTDKGNDRLMCAVGFLSDVDEKLTRKHLVDIKLKDAHGKKVVRETTDDSSKRRVSFKDLMGEGEDVRRNVEKKADNTARTQKKRMNERSGREV